MYLCWYAASLDAFIDFTMAMVCCRAGPVSLILSRDSYQFYAIHGGKLIGLKACKIKITKNLINHASTLSHEYFLGYNVS